VGLALFGPASVELVLLGLVLLVLLGLVLLGLVLLGLVLLGLALLGGVDGAAARWLSDWFGVLDSAGFSPNVFKTVRT
jgi:hypothetical protein